MGYTIRDYEDYLQMESGMFPYQTPLWKINRLDESKGIVDDYQQIIDELYNALINDRPVPFNDNGGYLAYHISNYIFVNENPFLESVNITVLSGTEGDSFFDGSNADFSSDANKMKNGKFVIRIKNKFLESKGGTEEFYDIMSHELQHAYRFYKVFFSKEKDESEETKEAYKREEALRMKRYGIAKDILEISSAPLNKLVSIGYYMSERNEINSEANRLYEYIRTHEEINEWNINEHLEELPLNSIVETLKNIVYQIDKHLDNKDFVNFVGTVYKNIVGDSTRTKEKALIKFRTRIIDSLMFAERLFARTTSKAFDDFNRRRHDSKPTTVEEFNIEMDDNFNLLEEILRKNKVLKMF